MGDGLRIRAHGFLRNRIGGASHDEEIVIVHVAVHAACDFGGLGAKSRTSTLQEDHDDDAPGAGVGVGVGVGVGAGVGVGVGVGSALTVKVMGSDWLPDWAPLSTMSVAL